MTRTAPSEPRVDHAQHRPPMSEASAQVVGALLRDVRRRLSMDVALVSHFEQGRRVIDLVDAAGEPPFSSGDSDPVEESYCQQIVDGLLPEVVPDTSASAAARALNATAALDIGAHLGVPIVLDDGTVYGTLCAYSHDVRPDLDDRSATMLGLIADTIGHAVAAEHEVWAEQQAIGTGIDRLLAEGLLTLVYQPLVELRTGSVVAVEALTRFPEGVGGTTADWFAAAAAAGRSTELQLAALGNVLADLPLLPADLAVHVNLTPDVLLDPRTERLLGKLPLQRIVLELSEHEVVADYDAVRAVLRPLRSQGMLVAVDDAGAGFASFSNALELKPDLLKLDIALVRGVDSDHSKRSLCHALVGFAHATEARIVAEGVETRAEAAALRALRVDLAQGYLFARPEPAVALAVAEEPPAAVADAEAGLTRESPVVVDLIESGASVATIAAALNRKGLLTPAGRRWHAASVRQLLL